MSKNQKPAANFGARLATLRKAAGYTQVELAAVLGISQRMVAYYEGTEDHPLAKVLRHLSHALDISTDELLGVIEVKTSSSTPAPQQRKTRPPRKT